MIAGPLLHSGPGGADTRISWRSPLFWRSPWAKRSTTGDVRLFIDRAELNDVMAVFEGMMRPPWKYDPTAQRTFGKRAIDATVQHYATGTLDEPYDVHSDDRQCNDRWQEDAMMPLPALSSRTFSRTDPFDATALNLSAS